jgi:hypothetical protein
MRWGKDYEGPEHGRSGTASDMIETDQIIFVVLTVIVVGALAASPLWWTAILLVGRAVRVGF